MSKKNSRVSGAFDNQVLIFLVEYCEEGEDYFESLVNLYGSYQKNHQKIAQGSFMNRWMTDSSFKKRLLMAGFKFGTYSPEKTGTRIWVMGLRLRDQPAKELFPTAAVVFKDSNIKVLLPQEQIQPYVGKEYIVIRGVTYIKSLIQVVRPIRPFTKTTKRDHGTVMTHVVTFRNPELRHQFLTSVEAQELYQQLGLEK